MGPAVQQQQQQEPSLRFAPTPTLTCSTSMRRPVSGLT